jgi:hypothetical protein
MNEACCGNCNQKESSRLEEIKIIINQHHDEEHHFSLEQTVDRIRRVIDNEDKQG